MYCCVVIFCRNRAPDCSNDWPAQYLISSVLFPGQRIGGGAPWAPPMGISRAATHIKRFTGNRWGECVLSKAAGHSLKSFSPFVPSLQRANCYLETYVGLIKPMINAVDEQGGWPGPLLTLKTSFLNCNPSEPQSWLTDSNRRPSLFNDSCL